MLRRRTKIAKPAAVGDDFCSWVSNLPFVVERPNGLAPSVHMYAVDCGLLGQSATWLMVDCDAADSPRPTSIAAVLPSRVARRSERSGFGRCFTPALLERSSRSHELFDRVVFKVDPQTPRSDVEAVVMAAYSTAIDWRSDERTIGARSENPER